jgi:hypothetical protein
MVGEGILTAGKAHLFKVNANIFYEPAGKTELAHQTPAYARDPARYASS